MPQHVNIFIDQYFTEHRNGYGHPESPKRILALLEMLQQYASDDLVRIVGLDQNQQVNPLLVHQADYLHYLEENIPLANTFLLLDEDTIACKESLNVALGGLKMMQQGINATFEQGQPTFVMTRPPGHHARPGNSMGFCIFNNIAYAAQYAREAFGVKKIAIVDWDVHHFNGTEEFFYSDPNTLTISLHQYPHWPEGYGWVDRRGEGLGEGYNLNVPMPKEAGDTQVMEVFERFILPELEAFAPELILVSAGFDAHRLERNSGLGTPSLLAFTEQSYSFMTYALAQLAQKHAQGRLMLALEGGYYLPSLQSGCRAVIETLIHNNVLTVSSNTWGENMDESVWSAYLQDIATTLGRQN